MSQTYNSVSTLTLYCNNSYSYIIPLWTNYNSASPPNINAQFGIPNGMSIQVDAISNSGYLYGIPTGYTDHVVYSQLSVAVNNDAGKTWDLVIRNTDYADLVWTTPSFLGTYTVNEISSLSVQAQLTNTNYIQPINYISYEMPDNLQIAGDGTLIGKFSNGGVYNFLVTATSVGSLSDTISITKQFSFNVISTTTNYTNISLEPLLSLEQKVLWQQFLGTLAGYVNHDNIYRPYDQFFALQNNFKMVLDYGIQELNLGQYLFALQQNFYKRRFILGPVTYTTATNYNNLPEYEVVYIPVIDKLKGSPLAVYDTLAFASTTTQDIYYPGSIDNMRFNLNNLETTPEQSIKVDPEAQPLFMRNHGYIPCIILCYLKPGYGQLTSNFINSTINFNTTFDFEFDRLLVEKPTDYISTKYLLLERLTESTIIPEDLILYGPDGIEWKFDDNDEITRTP